MARLHVILFAGGINEMYNFRRYKNDLELALRTVSRLPGFSFDHASVLFGEGGAEIELEGRVVSCAPGTREALKSAIGATATKCQPDDVFWFIASNHGGQIVKGTRNAKLYCWNEDSVPDSEFSAWCQALNADTQVFIFGQCYAGGVH